MKKPAWSFSALNNFETCPKKFWHLRIKKDYKEVEGEALLYGKRVHKALELYVAKGKPLPQEFEHLEKYVKSFASVPAEKLTELQLAISEEFVPVDWFDRSTWCRAMLDLVILGNTHALLVDYKTGKIKDDGFTQLKLAAALLLVHYPQIQTVDVAYLWTQHQGKTTRERYTRDQITEIWNELLPRVIAFEDAHKRDEFPARPSGLCRRHCPIESCPHHGG